MIPFFVADRPMSLRIIKGLPLQDYPNVRFGIMAHANTSSNFQEALRKYPCENLEYCDAARGHCQYQENICNCPFRKRILNQTVKICDSGIFTKEGATLTYKQLFEAYKKMGVEYGIMIDVYKDSKATVKSAKEALEVYKPYKDIFKLIAVAQGTSLDEYVNCYAQLRELGFQYIAIGGLLRRHEKAVRYARVNSEELMFDVLSKLRQKYPDDWLFALGCFNPSRLEKLQDLNVWADYKGWIFQYKKRNQTLNVYINDFISNHLDELEVQELNQKISKLKNTINERQDLVEKHDNLSQELYKGRRRFRESMRLLYQELQIQLPEKVAKFSTLTTRGLLGEQEKNLVNQMLQSLGKQESQESKFILDNIQQNRKLDKQIKALEKVIDTKNQSLAEQIINITSEPVRISKDAILICNQIARLVGCTEHEHRLEQVRSKIAQEVLKPLSKYNF
ncbi:hypothetical protein CEN50_09815 [Fischerella thermalis CCMEE 5268]|uniref:Uncharacterized protein n=1 Tax=Fischerella thermalis CCMEE 5268 TaxID=2019662 RepID=A0A2N6KHE0_9CYAN|nr:hypothetical protein [Fischerella thermalis]PLZ98799.1 hypothetical protein CEN50_09815 [Fischerella thermalis CCMEE 5268]